ncbi:MAG: NAD(P)H-dependent oxidoreductase [Pseudomonadota bacterium]
MEKTRSILRIDASMRQSGSVTRGLTDRVIARLEAAEGGASVAVRDLAEPLPFVTERWIGANFADPEARTGEQRDALALSDSLIAELKAADTLVIGLPIYNFGVPAAFKAWFDLVARARVTFRYTETGPVGLLEGKRAIVIVASGGTEVDGPIDFATAWLRHALGFIGIRDVEIVPVGRQMVVGEAALAAAAAQVDALAA